jgi:DNA-binding CsgD family transcriptional regulator
MNTANIIRPEVTNNFTALPNELLNYGRHINGGLKPRDSSVLNYLLSKPPHWKLRANDIANGVNISVNTVYAALTKLQKLGIASFTRDKFGYTHWVISLHTTLSSPVNTPHTKKPHKEFCDVLTNNHSLQNNKKTTTRCADFELGSPPILEKKEEGLTATIADNPTIHSEVIDESLILPEQFSEIEKQVAKKSIKKANLDSVTYSVILMALKTALTSGNVRSPMAYLNGLINKAKDGSLDISQYSENNGNKAPLNRREEIAQLFAKHGEKIRLDIVTNGVIKNHSLGYITYHEVKQMGLIGNIWVNKYNELQLAKMNQLSNVKPLSKPAKPPKVTITEAEFEAKRQEQIEKAMAMLEIKNSAHS